MLIRKDRDEKNVTRGAYEQLYKPLGYKPIVVIDVKPIEEVKEEIKKEPVSQKKTPKKIKK